MAAILSTSFAAPVTDWAAQWSLASVTGVQVGHLCAAESELAQVTKVGPGTMVTVRRGVEATSAAVHATGVPVAVSVAGDVATAAPVLGSSAVAVRQATLTLTDAQIKALPTTAVVLVAAPGPNRRLVPLQGAFLFQPAGNTYANVNSTFSALVLWPTPFDAWVLDPILNDSAASKSHLSNFLVSGLATAARQFLAFPYQDTANAATCAANTSDAVNQPLVIKLDNDGAGNLTGGTVANRLTVSVLYSIVDLTTGLWV